MRRYTVALIVATMAALLAPVMALDVLNPWEPEPGRRAEPAPAPSPTTVITEPPLHDAIGTLSLLAHAIREEQLGKVPSLVRKLAAERAIAAAAGADVSQLNELISAKLSPLKGNQSRIDWPLRYNLGPIAPS